MTSRADKGDIQIYTMEMAAADREKRKLANRRYDSDLWETPQWLFDELSKEFNFVIDLCADEYNNKCDIWCNDFLKVDDILEYTHDNGYDSDDEGLHEFYYNQGCRSLIEMDNRILEDMIDDEISGFMNPPYSSSKPFIEQAWEQSKRLQIVCLLKCDTSTKAWGIFWDYENHRPRDGCEVRFLPNRLKFERDGKPGQSANFPSAIVIMDRRP